MFVIYVNRNYFFNSGPCQCELLYLTTPHESLSFVAKKNWRNFLAKFAKTYLVCLFVVSIEAAAHPPLPLPYKIQLITSKG